MKRKLFTLSILVAAGNAIADTNITDTVVVTATRTEQASFSSLSSIRVIDRETIRHSQAHDVADLLRLEAGIDIARSGGPGQATSFFIRGSESNHTVVLVDGVKINPGTIGQSAIQHINPAMIERIEIVKGPRSTLYGSDAIGGVINIITRRDDRLEISATAGSFATRKLDAAFGQSHNGINYGIDIGLEDTDGFATRTTATQDSGYDNDSFTGFINLDQAWGTLELRHWRSSGNTEYVNFLLSPIDQDHTNQATALSGEFYINDIWISKITLSTMQDEIEQSQSTDFLETNRNTLDWQNDIEIGRHLVTAGVALQREAADAISFGSPYSADTDTDEIYIQDDINLGKHHLLVGARHTDHETFGTENTWNAGYGYEITDRTFLFANAGTGFRAPDATDRFGFGGNPGLKPETSRQYELGLRHQFSDSLRSSLSIFDNRIEDLISYDAVLAQNSNIDETRIKGIEANIAYTQTRWDASATLNIQDPQDESSNSQLLRRAERSLTGRFNYYWQHARIGAELITQSTREDIDANTFLRTTNPGYGIINLTADYQLTPDITVAARVENLTDKDYVLANGFAIQERSGFIALSYTPDGK